MIDVYYLIQSKLKDITEEHFFKYFFFKDIRHMDPVALSLCYALAKIDEHSPGYAAEMIKRNLSLKGKDEKVLEIIITNLSEIAVAAHAIDVANVGTNGLKYFVAEPGAKKKKKNPEFRSRLNDINYCIEVKSPSLITHMQNRKKSTQIPARGSIPIKDKENTTLPKDNPVKDYLINAQEKFTDYIEEYPEDYRLLLIVWDNFMYEPISALTNNFSGLLTEQSYYKNKNKEAVKFDLIDGIIVVRHLHNFYASLVEQPTIDKIRHMMDLKRSYNSHAFIQNPRGRKVPIEIIEAYQCMEEKDFSQLADYTPTDIIFWF